MYPRTLEPRLHLPGRALAQVLVLTCLLAALLAPAPPLRPRPDQPPSAPAAPAPPAAGRALERLPLSFVPNTGQTDPQVQFQTWALGGSVAFGASGLTLALPGADRQPARLRVVFVGARPGVRAEGRAPQPGLVNMYLGDDPARWRAALPTYAALVYPELYPSAELRYDGVGARLKGTYQLAPGADPARIRWRYQGAQRVRLDPASGDLELTLATARGRGRVLIERAPLAWQERDGRRRDVPARYDLAADGSVGFALGAYDPALPLTIDPTLEYSTYLGGTAFDEPRAMALDTRGSTDTIVLVGTSASYNFPLTTAAAAPASGADTNVFVTKLNDDGTALIFSTLFGGANEEEGNAVALDSRGQIVVAGSTMSQDLPVPPQPRPGFATTIYPAPFGGRDAFVATFDPVQGRLDFSTYLGGSGSDLATGVAVDRADRILVTGGTSSPNFPTSAPLQPALAGVEDLFVASISADWSALAFSTYLGGSGSDQASGIAVDRQDNLVVVGSSDSPDFPLKDALQPALAGATDAFVLGLGPNGAGLRFSTYLGGGAADSAAALALDPAGAIALTGRTDSADFPTVNARWPSRAGLGQDAFVASLAADGSALRFSTYLGGQGQDTGQAIVFDTNGKLVVAGATSSSDFPLASPTQAQNNGQIDIFVSRLGADGASLEFSTYLGGDLADYSPSVAVARDNTIIIAGATGSQDLSVGGPLQPYNSGEGDILLAAITSLPRLRLDAATDQSSAAPCKSADTCATLSFTFTLRAVDGPVPADLLVRVPPGLEVQPGSLSGGASYQSSTREIHLGGTVTPSATLTLSYQARLTPAAKPGALLTTSARATGPDHTVTASLPVSITQPDFRGTLVLIYASGDNDLAGAMQDLLANAARGSTNPAVLTLLLLDGPDPQRDDTVLYRLGPGAERCGRLTRETNCAGVDVWDWPGDQLATPQTLTAFLTGALRTYPNASRRVLSLVGHGGGWSPPLLEGQPSGHGGQPSRHGGQLGGMLWDNNPPSALSTPELGQALRDTAAQLGQAGPVFDLLFLDACDMAMVEVAYEVRGSASYLLASANWKWAAFPYDQHLPSAIGTGEQIGRRWLQQEAGLLRRWPEPFTYALIDLAQIPALRGALDTLAAALTRPDGPLSTPAGRQKLLAAATAADRFDSNSDGKILVGTSRADADTYVDIHSLAAQLDLAFGASDPAVAQAAQAVASQVNQAVVAQEGQNGTPWQFPNQSWIWTPSARLISIYLPLHYDDWRLRYYPLIQFGADGQWGELINRYWQSPAVPSVSYIPPEPPTCAADCPLPFRQLRLRPLVYLPAVRR